MDNLVDNQDLVVESLKETLQVGMQSKSPKATHIALCALGLECDDNIAVGRSEDLELNFRSRLLTFLQNVLRGHAALEELVLYVNACIHVCYHIVRLAKTNLLMDNNNNNNNNEYYSHLTSLAGTATANLPFLVLEDCMDALPMSLCSTLWNQCVLVSQDKLCSHHLFPSGRLTLLRLCNKLLQKKTTTAEHGGISFVGSVLLFLAKSFPLSERSGLNLLGRMNVESTTTYEDQDTFEHQNAHPPPASNNIAFDKPTHVVDYNLYRTFWRVQSYLSNPNLLLGKQEKPLLWNEFLTSVKRILTAFEGHPFSKQSLDHAKAR